ncbi:pentatricopeptide repeat-containing protein At3g25210, mitochondrial isoform X2 [Spinacia oleracea]|uniref:Pentatricopeptide repeat-containing protein At3g25210, mitochondrial isoform X2 n=1 Tax=Spinacia oleracea TaxID=3562 RepID=A0ABM3QLH8_SPIOL|nr:pentatricopeptide repeat-containing protein At3g25210, mitochondrial isoform X2 [Spinacia oleracea]
MITTFIRRALATPLRQILALPLHYRLLSTAPPPSQPHFFKSQTPSEKQFQTWVDHLKPGFTPSDVNNALNSQTDADLAYDIFRWTATQRGYTHDSSTYLTMIQLAVAGRRHRHAEALLEEVLAGACPMKALGVVPDTYVLNMIIKAYAKCLQVDEAVRVFREMGLYGCEPNAYSYGYLFKGCCEKGRVWQGFGFFKEMREKGLVPSSGAYMVLVCSLALERKFEDAVEVLRDMLGNALKPDLLTYKTLLEEMCRDGQGVDALELLEEFRKTDVSMGEKTYRTLLDTLHFVDR